jgi:S1-C subfamily serine protease
MNEKNLPHIFVPINLLNPILSDLIIRGRSREVPRPWLDLNAEESHGRVFVLQVTPKGPAEQAGLHVRDLILIVNGKAVNGLADFYRKVWALGNAGIDVSLGILRGI